MIVLKEIAVEGYKNIGNSKVSFTNFNVITGPNNAGKSNFIQILSFIDFVINGSPDQVEKSIKYGFFPLPFNIVIAQYSDSNLIIQDKNTKFFLTFFDTSKEISFLYALEIKWSLEKDNDIGEIIYEKFQIKHIRKTGKPTTIFERIKTDLVLSNNFKKLINVKKVSSYSSVLRLLKIVLPENEENEFQEAINNLDKVLKAPIYYFSNIELSKKVTENRLNVFNGRTVSMDLEQEIAALEQTKNWDLFKEVLHTILNVEDIEVHRLPNTSFITKFSELVEITCYIDHLNEKKLLNKLSDGSLLLIALITKILLSEHVIFLIEEPENSLHPKALQGLINFIRSFEDEKQFIITSHSIALINMIKPEDVIVSKVNENGTSDFTNIENAKELRKKLRNGYLDFSDFIFFNDDEIEEEITTY